MKLLGNMDTRGLFLVATMIMAMVLSPYPVKGQQKGCVYICMYVLILLLFKKLFITRVTYCDIAIIQGIALSCMGWIAMRRYAP